jgi:hypothetical protein
MLSSMAVAEVDDGESEWYPFEAYWVVLETWSVPMGFSGMYGWVSEMYVVAWAFKVFSPTDSPKKNLGSRPISASHEWTCLS